MIEGWHPSRPEAVGFNLMVDGEWIGTFATLDDAATAAFTHLARSDKLHETGRKVALISCLK